MKPRYAPLALPFLLALIYAPAASARQAAAPAPPGQTAPARESASETSRARTPARQQTTATADESFALEIPLRRIVEEDFLAATEVAASGELLDLHVRVGVFVRAERIELVLREVRGFVRFRASLAPVLRLLDGRRMTTVAPAPAGTSP
jgi:hypothetical protein